MKASILFLVMACASAPVKEGYSLKPYRTVTLKNGLQVFLVKDASLPVFSIQMLVSVGLKDDPSHLPGLSNIVGELLDRGTSQLDENQLADAFAEIGGEVSISTQNEYSLVSASALSIYRERLTELLWDCLQKSDFRDSELQKVKSQVQASIQKLIDNPSAYADYLANKEYFKGHPFSNLAVGSMDSIKKIKRSDVLNHFKKSYRPNNAFLAVVGDFSDEFEKSLLARFESWEPKEHNLAQNISLSSPKQRTLNFVSKPELAQTQIRYQLHGIPRNHPDFLALRAANVVLGGSFASRLNQKIRDDLGLTYSISSQFGFFQSFGVYNISTFTRNDKLAETVFQTDQLVKEFIEKGVSDKELEAAKALLIGQFPLAIETSDKLATNLMLLRFYGVPSGYLENFIKNVKALSVVQVNQAIKNNLDFSKVILTVFADKAKVKDQLLLLK
jgi:zinc protease